MSVASHRQIRLRAHRHGREDPLAGAQPQIQKRRRLVEAATGLAVGRREMRHIAHQIVAIMKQRLRHLLLAAAGEAQHDAARPEHVDVLNVVAPQQRLQRPRPQQRLEPLVQPHHVTVLEAAARGVDRLGLQSADRLGSDAPARR